MGSNGGGARVTRLLYPIFTAANRRVVFLNHDQSFVPYLTEPRLVGALEALLGAALFGPGLQRGCRHRQRAPRGSIGGEIPAGGPPGAVITLCV